MGETSRDTPPGAQSVPRPDGDTLGSAPGRRASSRHPSVLGYVEADEENGENLWAVPSVPAVPSPGDAPFPLLPLGQRRERLGPTWCLLCPILHP